MSEYGVIKAVPSAYSESYVAADRSSDPIPDKDIVIGLFWIVRYSHFIKAYTRGSGLSIKKNAAAFLF